MSFMATWDTTPMDGELGRVEDLISGMNRVAVCFSGGLDSTVLADIAYRTIGNRAVAIMADVPMMSDRQRTLAASVADSIGIGLITVRIEDEDLPSIFDNPGNRCYICKTAMYLAIRKKAEELGIRDVMNAEIVDDLSEDRPGMKAGKENSILRPFIDCGIDRDSIKEYIRKMNLPMRIVKDTCLLMRFPVGVPVTHEDLKTIEYLESEIRRLTGVNQLRIRRSGDSFAVQTSSSELNSLIRKENEISLVFEKMGSRYSILGEGYDK